MGIMSYKPLTCTICSPYCLICAHFVHCYCNPLSLLHTQSSFHPLIHQLHHLPTFLSP